MKQLLIKFLLTLIVPLLGSYAHAGLHPAVPAQRRHIESAGHTQRSSEKIRAVEIDEDDDVEQACKQPGSTISYFTYSPAAAHIDQPFTSCLTRAEYPSYTSTSRCILYRVIRI